MKNKLALLGFASLLGLLGIFTENKWYLGFFGFAVYFRYLNIIPDELFCVNVQKSASRAFFAGLSTELILTLVLLCFYGVNRAAVLACVIGSTIALIVFTFFLSYYENAEKGGIANED